MFADESAAVALCKQYYQALEKRDVGAILAMFADDAVVVIGAGASGHATDYSGIFAGKAALHEHYTERFASKLRGTSVKRPFCALLPSPHICFPWIIFCGNFEDTLIDGTPSYKGGFLHVWTLRNDRIVALDAFLDHEGRIPMRPPGTAASVM